MQLQVVVVQVNLNALFLSNLLDLTLANFFIDIWIIYNYIWKKRSLKNANRHDKNHKRDA